MKEVYIADLEDDRPHEAHGENQLRLSLVCGVLYVDVVKCLKEDTKGTVYEVLGQVCVDRTELIRTVQFLGELEARAKV